MRVLGVRCSSYLDGEVLADTPHAIADEMVHGEEIRLLPIRSETACCCWVIVVFIRMDALRSRRRTPSKATPRPRQHDRE